MSRKGKGRNKADAKKEVKPTVEAAEEVENEVSEGPEVDETLKDTVEPETSEEDEAEAPVPEESAEPVDEAQEVVEETAPVCDACRCQQEEDLHPVLVGKLTFNVCDDCAPQEGEKSSEIELSPELAGPEKGMAVNADPKVRINAGRKEKKVGIIIDFQENTDKNADVKCTDGQGRQFVIKRNHEVDVPVGVVNVLTESVITQQTKDADGNDVFQDMPRFAFRILKKNV